MNLTNLVLQQVHYTRAICLRGNLQSTTKEAVGVVPMAVADRVMCINLLTQITQAMLAQSRLRTVEVAGRMRV
jgi:hypothetical protein